MKEGTMEVLRALQAMGYEVLYNSGTFAIRGKGLVSLAQARKMTGIQAPKREVRERVTAYGDWAWVAAINGRLNG